MNRRNALKLLTGSAAAAVLGPSPSLKADSVEWKTAVGLNGFMSSSKKYDKTFPIWEVLDYSARTGFDGVELVRGWPQGNYPLPDQSGRIAALKRLYDAYGLQVFSIQTGAGGAFSANAEMRQRWLRGMQNQLKFAKAVGCDCIGMWPGGRLRGQTLDEAIGHIAESFREVAKMGDDMGIITAFEIEPPFIFNTEQSLRQILEKANDSRVKTIYDSSHFDLMNKSVGNPHEMLQRIGVENIGYVHFTDTDGSLRDGGTSKHLAAGDGHIDVAASFKTLKDGGFNGWIMIDSWQIPDPYDASTKGLKAIKSGMRE
ncbi:MAG TPA: sugar phosphate isomerase/epimerase [Verrucomicrobiales bacterium]|nr:sugar phosphate isomerase/epimerase [Verrucomicrobiales bacterium]